MQQMRVKVVELHQETGEYQKVKRKFCQTCNAFKIDKVQFLAYWVSWTVYCFLQYIIMEETVNNKARNGKAMLSCSSCLGVCSGKKIGSLPLIFCPWARLEAQRWLRVTFPSNLPSRH